MGTKTFLELRRQDLIDAYDKLWKDPDFINTYNNYFLEVKRLLEELKSKKEENKIKSSCNYPRDFSKCCTASGVFSQNSIKCLTMERNDFIDYANSLQEIMKITDLEQTFFYEKYNLAIFRQNCRALSVDIKYTIDRMGKPKSLYGINPDYLPGNGVRFTHSGGGNGEIVYK